MSTNPFVPGWGDTPPTLAGRDALIHRLIAGLLAGPQHPEYHNILTGLRGVGKTVLLNEIIRYGREHGHWQTLRWTATRPLAAAVTGAAPELRRQLAGRVGRRLRRVEPSLTLKAAPGGIGAEARLERRADMASSDAYAILQDLARVAAARQQTLVIVVDELQGAAPDDLRTVAVALQDLAKGDHLPLALLAAGLPSLKQRIIGAGVTFFARQQLIPVGNLSAIETAEAIATPFEANGRHISDAALDHLIELSGGYPYAVQVAGYHTWDQTDSHTATIVHARAAEAAIRRQIESTLYESAWSMIRPSEHRYVISAADIAAHTPKVSTSEIAEDLGKPSKGLSPIRDRLINEVQVLEASTRGTVQFTVPGFAEWVRDNGRRLARSRSQPLDL